MALICRAVARAAFSTWDSPRVRGGLRTALIRAISIAGPGQAGISMPRMSRSGKSGCSAVRHNSPSNRARS